MIIFKFELIKHQSLQLRLPKEVVVMMQMKVAMSVLMMLAMKAVFQNKETISCSCQG